MRSLRWSDNDAHLVSCGTEGAVYEWKLKTFKRSRENVLKVHRRLHACAQKHTQRASVSGLEDIMPAFNIS